MSVCTFYWGYHVTLPLISRLPCPFALYIKATMSLCPLYRGYYVCLPRILILPCQFAPYFKVTMSVCALNFSPPPPGKFTHITRKYSSSDFAGLKFNLLFFFGFNESFFHHNIPLCLPGSKSWAPLFSGRRRI